MDERSDAGMENKQSFSRIREIARSHTPQEILGIVSFFAVAFALKSLFSIYLSNLYAWTSTIVPIAFLSYCYNAVCQARGRDIKYALILDWLELKTRTHVLIIIGSGIVVGLLKLLALAPAADAAPSVKNNNPIALN